MPENWWMFFVVGLIPLIIGGIWYGPLFGKKWMSINGFTEESLKGANMPLIFGLTFLFSSFVAVALSGIVVHQTNVFQMMMPEVMEVGHAAQQDFTDMMMKYGGNFRDFKHGVLHGVIITIVFALPLIAINALFERRGWTYIMIHTGYWLVCLPIMGGVLCSTLYYAPIM